MQVNKFFVTGAASVLVLLFVWIELTTSAQENLTSAQLNEGDQMRMAPDNSIPCQCVVFRMDDIQDSFVNNAQVEAMNLFLSKGQPLSLGIIMKDIGEDTRITGKVGEGSQRGLFELGLHGWEHVDYTTLSETEQKSTLNEANEKLKMIFGNISDIFVPPFGYYNNETIRAMEELGIRLLSASLSSDKNFDDNNGIFNKTNSESNGRGAEVVANMTNLQKAAAPENDEIYHLPGMVLFKNYENGSIVKVPHEKIMSEVSKNIAEYGYSVFVFHPQDLVQTDKNGKILGSGILNSTEVDDLSQLIDTFLTNGIKISTLSEIVGVEPRTYSYF